MKGFKGFAPGLVCRGKQYAENTVFEEPDAEICKSGMHFCENPFDVLDYYDLVNADGSFNDFAEVEALDEAKTDDHKKYCTTKLRVGAKLSFSGFVNACVDFMLEKTKGKNNKDKVGSSGEWASIGSSGADSVICCAGHGSKVRAMKGSWITLAEWKWDAKKKRYVPLCVKTEQVDGVRIKEDVLYMLKDGEFVEVEE